MELRVYAQKSRFVYLSVAGLVVILNIIAWCSTTFCDAYIKYLFPVWVNTYGRFMGMFPFSVGELLLVAGVICVFLFVVFILICIMLGIYPLLKSEGYIPGKIANGLWKLSKGYFCFFGWVLLAVCMIMTLNCTILYHASTFSEQYYGEEDGDYTVEELIAVRNLVVERCNTLSAEMERDANGDIVYTGDMKAEAIAAMQKLGKQYDQLDGYYPTPKPLAASNFFSQQYIGGYYFPFSLEAMRRRSARSRISLRRRRLLGVTSRSSSSARNSRFCSRENFLGGTRRSASSEPDARMLETCFCLQTLTAMSSPLGFMPTIMPP